MNRLYAIGERADDRPASKQITACRCGRRESSSTRELWQRGLACMPEAAGLTASTQQTVWRDRADLQAHMDRSLVIAGEEQPPAVHALAHAINEALGNVGHDGRLY